MHILRKKVIFLKTSLHSRGLEGLGLKNFITFASEGQIHSLFFHMVYLLLNSIYPLIPGPWLEKIKILLGEILYLSF